MTIFKTRPGTGGRLAGIRAAAAFLSAAILFVLFSWSAAAAGEKVVLQLCWDHQFQFAGYYAAKWQGYYEEAGLDVEIRPAVKPDRTFLSPLAEVAKGRAHFGIGASDILVGRDKGMPLVVLAPIFQHSAAEFYVLRDSSIQTPADLVGKTAIRRENDLIEAEFFAMLRAEGVDPGQLEFVPFKSVSASMQSLLSGEIDVVLGYALTTPYQAMRMGVELSSMRPSMYGIDFYGDTLFSSTTTVSRHPEMVGKFVKASLKGWEYALDHPEEIAWRISTELPRQFPLDDPFDFNLFQVQGVMKLCPYPHVGLGHNNPERWQRMHEYLKQSGLVEGKLDLQELIYDPLHWAAASHKQFLKWLYGSLIFISGFALVSMVWAMSLRKIVAARTRALVDSNVKLKNEIADRERAERELRLSENFYRAVFENTGTPMMIVEEDTTISLVNSNFEGLVGYEKEEVEGRMSWQMFVKGEDLAKMSEYHRMRRIDPDAAPRSYEAQVFDKEGIRRDVIITADIIPGTKKSVASVLDITDIKKVEKALKDSTAQRQAILDASVDMIMLYDTDLRIIWANRTAADVVGKRPEELIGHKCHKIFQDKDQPCPGCPAQRALRSGHIEHAVMYQSDMDMVGESWWDDYAVPLLDDETGKIVGVIEIARNITESKRFENDLRASEARYKGVVEDQTELIFRFRPEGQMTFANSAYRRYYGIGPDETVSSSFMDCVHDRYKELVVRSLEDLSADNPSVMLEIEITRPEGEVRWQQITFRAIYDDAGQIMEYQGVGRDITHRKLAETALRESEERFRQLVENIQEVFWIRDIKSGDMLYVSPAYEKILEQRISSFPTTEDPFIDYVHPEDRGVVEQALEEYDKVHALDMEFRIVNSQGGMRWIRERIFPIPDSQGNVYRSAGLAEDVTERKEAEEALRRSEERFRLLVDYMPVLIHAHDQDLNYVFWNKESVRVTGYSSEQIVGKPEAMKVLYPDRGYRKKEVYKRHGGKMDYRNWENRVTCSDGSTKIISWSNLSNRCPIPGWHEWEMGLDVTERRKFENALAESEARYRFITESLPVGVLLMDRNYRIVASNSTMRRWFPNIRIESSPYCFYSLFGRDFRCTECPCAELGKGRNKTVDAFKEMIIEGEARKFKITACSIPAEGGEFDQYMVIYTDVTEEEKLNEKLRQAQRTDLIATMGTGIAHEINQPLNALKLWVTGLMMNLKKSSEVNTDMLLGSMDKILGATERIETVIEHMRTLINKGDDSQIGRTDLNDAINKALMLVSAKIKAHNITLNLDLSEKNPMVLANPIQLEQVIINLVTNSIDAHDTTENPDKRISISTRLNQGTASIIIEDNGPGFKGSEEQIFDPFYTTKGSMGLGLSLVNTFVSTWGGKISASASSKERGARICVDLKPV
jgi:PAS domain S-box-containing protein